MLNNKKNSITLKELLDGCVYFVQNTNDPLEKLSKMLGPINSIALNSNAVQVGGVFVALKGAKVDGHDFIAAALERGASLILSEELSLLKMDDVTKISVPIIAVRDLKNKLSMLAKRIYSLACAIELIGITGTNGKTSTAYFLYQALCNLGQKAAYIGTIGMGTFNKWQDNAYTTPDLFTLYQQLHQLALDGIQVVAMEVTSHALAQGRVDGLQFSTAAFTNLTRDHLDYHVDFASYGLAKSKLFTDFNAKKIVLNFEDPYSFKLLELINDLEPKPEIYLISEHAISENMSMYQYLIAQDIKYLANGISAKVITNLENNFLTIPLLGTFNLNNILLVMGILLSHKYSLQDAIGALNSLQAVPGRMQLLKEVDVPLVIIDYAHTPDALQKALLAIRAHCVGNIYCVFGCGGDRDPGKRKMMGAISEQYANKSFVTSDNPRTEDPLMIIKEIISGFSSTSNLVVEPLRSAAITQAILAASKDDIVLVAGKGHEEYQIIGKEKINYSDKKEVLRSLNVYREVGASC